jgi:methylenetetrahydrofolate dehydrogenase (NADP+)/methenyltetrahydrofolate cyclohydrolase
VGERPDDLSYENGAKKRCEKQGVAVRVFALPAEVTQDELLGVVSSCNLDDTIHGILLFRPLPKTIQETLICEAISPAKDVDGVTSASLASVFMNGTIGFPPCTAQACVELLDFYEINVTGMKTVVLGRSLVVGKPLAMLLLARNATVTICHTKTKELERVCHEAQILCAAAGQKRLIGEASIGEGAIVLDVGIHVEDDGQLCGDVNYEQVVDKVSAITPVPGGVGAVTTSLLAYHVALAARKSMEADSIS